MMTVRTPNASANGGAQQDLHDDHTPGERAGSVEGRGKPPMDSDVKGVSNSVLAWMTLLSLLVFGSGLSIAMIAGGL
jgi:hypothetical protein